MSTDLLQLFIDSVRVDALSLRERPMAAFVREALGGLPVDIHEDDTAVRFNGECGNLICIPRTFTPSRPAVALLAHMDTPRTTVGVRPIVSNARVHTDGTTALGVDNRAGTSVLLAVLREHLASNGSGNFIVVFTVAEELGLYGSKYVDLTPYNVRMCFVFDCSRRPGTFIRAAVGCSLYTAVFRGLSSHAAVAPEKGVNAIRLAAQALAGIPMGRLGPTMTSNAGLIAGGTATNVVPDRCTVTGEVREFDPGLIAGHLQLVEGVFRKTAEEGGGGLDFQVQVDFEPFRLAPDAPVMSATTEVLRRAGLEPNPIEYLGGSDANMLNAKGVPAVNLGIGAQNPHGNDEFILIEDLHATARIAQEVIRWSVTQ
jgi:tripeptide aminopeptidase